jgi:DNA-binding beta-propeller fold protein YncE
MPGMAYAGNVVTSGPSYVQVSGSPFTVGGGIDALAFSPTGSTLATADYGSGQVESSAFNGTTGALSPVPGSPFSSGRGTDSVAFSPNGQLLAAANLRDDSVAVFTVGAAGTLAAAPGSPAPTGGQPRAVAFSPSGNLLAVANQGDASQPAGSVSVYQVGAGGALTQAPGSPFDVPGATSDTQSEPVALSFNPSGSLLAVADEGDGTVSIFTVGGSTLTPSAGSPLGVGDAPGAVAFSPSGGLLAVANGGSSSISVFTTAPAAFAFIPVPGSPFATGSDPLGMAFDSGGDLLASADALDGTVAVFSVSSTDGSLALVQGSPFVAGGTPHSVAFVPNGKMLAVSSSVGGTVSVLEPMPAPTAGIAVPANQGFYVRGTHVSTNFNCSDGNTGPGVVSCTDSQGAKPSGGPLDTRTLGRHKFAVTAISGDGLSYTTKLTYRVVPAPPAVITQPQTKGEARVGAVLSCGHGTWRGKPTRYSYQWQRGGVALAGEDRATLRVTRLDQGSGMVCEVTAHNGNSAAAASNTVAIPLTKVRGCPSASGSIRGTTLGQVSLGQTRAAAAIAMYRSRHDRESDRELLCLEPAGITVGVPTRQLRRLLGGWTREHVVWALTANPHYIYDGVGPGISFAVAQKLLTGGTLIRRGSVEVYLVRLRTSTLLLLAHHRVVTEIGIAQNRATSSARRIAALVPSLS